MSNRKILKNSFANYIGIFGQIAIAFLLTPFLVRSLGDSQYGIWSIATALTGYMCLMDLGISSAVNRYVARFHASHDHDSLNATVSTALVMFLAISLVISLTSPLTASLIVNHMSIDPSLRELVYVLIIIIAFDVCIFITGNLFKGVFGGLQRYEIINYTQIISAIYKAIMFYLFLSEGHGLITMGWISLSAHFLTGIGYFFLLKHLYPFIKLNIKLSNKNSAKTIASFSSFTFLAMLANQIIYYSDAFIIGYFMTSAAITYYSISWSLSEYSKRLCVAISSTYSPAFSAKHSANDIEGIKTLFLSGTKYMLIVSNLLGVGVIVLGGAFIAIWMGPKYKELCETVLIILFINLLVQAPQLVSYAALQGLAKQQLYAYVSLAVSFANLALSILLVQQYGIVGVAIGTVVPQLIFHGLFVPLYTTKVLGLSRWLYLRSSLLPVLAPSVLLFFTLRWAEQNFLPEGYGALMLVASVCSLIYFVAVYFLTLNNHERLALLAFIRKKTQRSQI